ncbi:MAG: PaaI family thioesterase [Chloroflexota bacterium]|nr:PaaI family thioesterase [Chloroflexota bacterium]
MNTEKASGVSAGLEELRAKLDSSPYARFLGMKVVELSPGHAKVALTLTPDYQNWSERPHGGVIMTLADHAFGGATNALGQVYFAAEFHIHLLSSPEPGATLYATARVVRAGKRLVVAEMEVEDAQGKAIARASGTGVPWGET